MSTTQKEHSVSLLLSDPPPPRYYSLELWEVAIVAVLADLGDGGEINLNDSRNKFVFGKIKVRHCCCVPARCLGKETKCSPLVTAYFALFNNVFEALNLFLIIYQNTRVLARVLPWLANGDHVMYSTNALRQQLLLTAACSWASLLKPYIQQAIISFYQSTKHESQPLSFT